MGKMLLKNIHKLIQLILEENKNIITFERKYLSEFFDSSLVLSIDTPDGLPVLIPRFERYIFQKGFIVKYKNSLVSFCEEEELTYNQGRYAAWPGEKYKPFRRWRNREKAYLRNKRKISFDISKKTKKEWVEFIKKSDYSTISKLIIDSIRNFVSRESGYNDNIVTFITDIFEQSISFEKALLKFIELIQGKIPDIDILIMHQDPATIKLITSYYHGKGYKCWGATTSWQGLEVLKEKIPKMIMLGINLPDSSGYKVSKTIKSDDKYENVLIYYLSAVSPNEIETHIKETRADGFISIPFNFSDLDNVIKYLKPK